MKKRIFWALVLIAALGTGGGLLLGWAAEYFALPLLPRLCGGLGLLALLALAGSTMASRATRRALGPLEEFSVHSNPDGPPSPDRVDEELAPILERLRERRRDFRRQIGALTDDRDAAKIIIGNMQKALEKQREDFSANLSQLQAPLASISALGERIKTGEVSGEDVQRPAELVTRESTRLLALIDDMLRLSRLDEENPAPMTKVSLTSVCRESLTSLSLVAHRRGVSLKLTGPEVWTRGSAEMLRELMACLCENAIKYNREEGSVLVETGADPAGKTVWVAVRDTGVGIPEEAFQRIFERFYRADNSLSDQAGGTGLGLAIAKRLADCHQGGISLESTLGEGSVFTVTLPAWQGEDAPSPAESPVELAPSHP